MHGVKRMKTKHGTFLISVTQKQCQQPEEVETVSSVTIYCRETEIYIIMLTYSVNKTELLINLYTVL